jgi:hypothetical protein
MFKRGYLGLMMSANVFILLSLTLVWSGGTEAAGFEGTYNSTIPGEGYFDSTYPADFTYDAELTLGPGGDGSLWLRCTDVVVNVAGWDAAYDMLGKSQTVDIDWEISGSGVKVTINDNYGGHYPLQLSSSGNRLYGSGSYTDISYVTNSWQMDVTKGGGGSSVSLGLSGIAGLAGAAAVGGFLVGFAVSLLPPPRNMGGSNMPRSTSPLGTPYAPSQSVVLDHKLSSMANQQYPGGVTRPLPEYPRMRMTEPMQFPNVQMGQTTVVGPTNIHQTDVLKNRTCPNCGSILMVTAAGWSCPNCNRAPPGGLDPQ